MGAITAVMAPEFVAQMRRLIGLKFAPTTMDTHWEGLRDVTVPELTEAVNRAQRECEEFPSPKMLRVFVDEARARDARVADIDRSMPVDDGRTLVIEQAGLTIPIAREWRYYCEDCRDVGMRAWWCGEPADDPAPFLERGRRHCGRTRPHYSHEFVEPCACAAHNPDVLKRKAQARAMARTKDER